MNISEPFIRRPVATSLLMLGVLVFGIAAYHLLPVSSLPNVDFPTITVSANLPGASPETMASSVATPLEQKFSAVPGLGEMTSLSGVGTTTITLQFDLSTDINGAAQDVQTAINAASGLLPKDLPSPPTYRKVNPNNFPVLIYAVHSDAMPAYKVDQYLSNVLAQPLSMIRGVGGVFIFGQKKYAVRVEANPMALAARHIGLEAVRTALANATVNLPKGEIIGPERAVSLDSNDQLADAASYRNIIIAYRDGAPVHLKDVATVVNSEENTQVGAWYGSTPAEGLAIERSPGSNALAVIDRVKTLMPRLQRSLPPSIKVELMSDRSELTRAAITDVQYTMLLTIGLVIVVIFAFLRSLWATLIPSLVVPLSLLATFAAMYVAGYTLDNISLMGLTISVGFLIDDAIVMIENIVRHIEAGERPMQAALRGAGQIGFTIVSITCSLIAVFIPIFFMGGVVGRLFHEFAATVAIAVLASAFFSLTLTPVLCSLFLKSAREQRKNRVNEAAERGFAAVLRAYDRGLGFVFRHQPATLAATLILAMATVYLYVVIPKGFVPEQDTGLFFGLVETRQDSSFHHTVKSARQILDIIDHDPGVGGVFLHAGAYSYNPGENTGHIFGQLKPFDERDGAQTILQRLRKAVTSVVGAKLFMQIPQAIRVGGRLARTEYQYTLTDIDSDELNKWAPIMAAAMKKLPQLQDVASDQQIAAPHIDVVVDRQKAEQLGLSAALIDQTLYDAFGQRQVATIYGATDQNKVVLEVAPQFTRDPTILQRLFIAGPTGAEVPLSAVAHYTSRLEPLTISHQGVFPAVTLSFNLTPGVALGQAVTAIDRMVGQLHAPPTLNGSFEGTAQAFQTSLTSMPLLLAAAILVVYIVLGMLYESYIHPITILSALPAAGVGALIMLWACHYDLSVIAIIGIVLLIGIVKKNAIMMIDFALSAQRREGKSARDAIREACLLRFRPIMMTTFSALFGSLPIALGQGAGSELRQPMGIAFIGGLLVSQWLTLYTTPVIYLYLDRLAGWLGGAYRQPRLADALSPVPQPIGLEESQGAE
ncbi:MAG TPA: efflux RND transporter permease subunit [Stellaceae bacterium]|nr:efflux RND transporter permease subunit [Stellaceae bacterium]